MGTSLLSQYETNREENAYVKKSVDAGMKMSYILETGWEKRWEDVAVAVQVEASSCPPFSKKREYSYPFIIGYDCCGRVLYVLDPGAI